MSMHMDAVRQCGRSVGRTTTLRGTITGLRAPCGSSIDVGDGMSRVLRSVVVAVVVIAATCAVDPGAAGAATTRTWVGPNGGSWSIPANWSPPGVPEDGDSLVLPGVACCGGLVSVVDIPRLTVADLTFPSGDVLVSPASPSKSSITVTGDIVLGTDVDAVLRLRVDLPAGTHEIRRGTHANLEMPPSGAGTIEATGIGRAVFVDATPLFSGEVHLRSGELFGRPGTAAVPTTISPGASWTSPGHESVVLVAGGTGGAAIVGPISGPVTVPAGDVALTAADVRGPISGPGRLVARGDVVLAGHGAGWTGGVVVASGSVGVSGDDALGTGPVEVLADGRLVGIGARAATTAPVTSDGQIYLAGTTLDPVIPVLATGPLTLGDSSRLRVTVAGTTPGVDAGQLAVTGAVRVGGQLGVEAPAPLDIGTTAVVIANDGTDAVVGQFADAAGMPLAEGAVFSTLQDRRFEISYVGGDGNDVTVTATDRPVAPIPKPETPPKPVTPADALGYWMLEASGTVHGFGQAVAHPAAPTGGEAVDIEPTPTGSGYWTLDEHGEVRAYGGAPELGSGVATWAATGERFTSLSATPSGQGCWLFTERGRVVAIGDAQPLGDLTHLVLNGPVLDSIATPTGDGYYMVASDGGIFAFGDAAFLGSMGGLRLNEPVQSLVPTASGAGYWLVASDGGVFAFGDAGFRGSIPGVLAPGRRLNRPITGMVRFGDGYLMVAEDGGIFAFSDEQFYGSLGDDPPPTPVTSVAILRA
jgi:hypothetical protein